MLGVGDVEAGLEGSPLARSGTPAIGKLRTPQVVPGTGWWTRSQSQREVVVVAVR